MTSGAPFAMPERSPARLRSALRPALRIGFLSALWAAFAWTEPALAREDPFLEAARENLETLSLAFRAVYQKVRPAVVLITTTHHRSGQSLLPRFHPELPPDAFPELGSGTIVDPDGYILSNYHVIEGADSILVTLADRRIFQAEVVGFDSLIDIALLKIDATHLPAVEMGNSDELQIGDWVLAIGHPLGMGSTLTHGIVSALGRQARIIDDEYGIESFIQTNAVINPGNSGGPLLNLRGEVVGINTAISTRTGYYMGYGLAVPVNLAQEAMDDLLAYGRVVRGYLGIEMAEVTQDLLRSLSLKMDHPQGVYIEHVMSGSPAERGGLKEGDIILSVDGRPVDRPNQIQTLIYSRDPGDRTALTLLRSGETLRVEVLLGEREEDLSLAKGQERLFRLGMTVETLSRGLAEKLGFTDELSEKLGIPRPEKAVVVTGVAPGGPAESKGIEQDEVITGIDHHPVISLRQFLHLLSGFTPGERVLLWLWHPHQGIDVRVLEIPE